MPIDGEIKLGKSRSWADGGEISDISVIASPLGTSSRVIVADSLTKLRRHCIKLQHDAHSSIWQ